MRSTAKTAALLLVFTGAAWALSVQSAYAAVAQQVQSGTATNSANGIQTITISGVDPTKSFLIFQTRSNSNRPVGSTVRGRIPTACANPCTTVEFERVTDGVAPEPATINIQWYVVTFGSGVKVQRGEVAVTATPLNVPITAVAAVNQAFVLWSKTPAAGDGTYSSDDPVVGEITSTTNLQFRSNVAGGAAHIIAWQVVEFTSAADINIQKGSTSLTAGALSTTATLSPAVNVNKTFLLVGFNTNGTGADIGARMLRAQLTNSTTITFDRSIGGDADDMTEIHWQAVELKDASIVWSGTSNFAAGISQATAALSPWVNTTRAVAFGSVQSGGGQNMGRSPYAGDDIIGVGSVTASLGTAFRAAASAGAGLGVLTLTINVPTGTLEGDLMVASIGFRPQTAVITPPSGWTLVRRTDNAGGNSLATYQRVAIDPEPASYNWTFDTSTGSAGGILSFAGVDSANPVDVENGQNTASALTHDAPSVTTTAANEMIVTAHSFMSSATWTPPAGMTEAVDVASEALGCCGQSIEVNYALQALAGATGTKTATASNDADIGNTHTLALRLSARATHLTLTRDSTVDTADVGWFVVQFNQGAGFRVGSFTKSTTTPGPVTQTIAHGLGEKPKAIILWTNGKTNESFSGSYLFGYGMTDGSTSKSVAAASRDAQGTSNTTSRMASKALTIVEWGEVLRAEADLQSWDDTNFTLNWTTNNATAYVIHYVVIGGSDVSAKVVEWTMATATGNQSIAGVGFQPNVVLHAHSGYLFTGASGTNLAGATLGLGAMDADGQQWAVSHYAVDNSALADTQRGQQTDGSIYSFDNSLTVQKKASFVSMNADGFTVNFTNATSTNAARVFSLALKGVNVQVGSFNKTTTTPAPVSQSIGGVNFHPSLVMLTSFQDVVQASPVAHGRFGIGASDGTTKGSSALADEDPPTTTNVDAIDKTSKVFVKVNNATTIVDAEADLTSLNDDGFTLNWTTNDAVATQILYLALAPLHVTEVRLLSFDATRYDRGVLLQWKTGYELDNLGFHVYREIDGKRTRVTSSIVAGSGLMLARGTAVTAERSYATWDVNAASADPSALYWLEDLDLNGKSTWHGPLKPVAGGLQVPPPVVTSTSLHELTRRARARGGSKVRIRAGWDDDAREARQRGRPQTRGPQQTQWALAAEGSVKIGINRAGWYRLEQPALVSAGLSPTVDPRRLRLFADGVEQAFRVVGEADGRLDAGDSIEFFATGVDTPYTDTRVYWLAPGLLPGRRLGMSSRSGRAVSGRASFWYSLQQKERLIYFAALRNGDEENWFGQPVGESEATEVTVGLSNVDRQNLSTPAEIELALQGVTVLPGDGPDHRVSVLVNGLEIDEVSFNAQERPVFHLALPPDVLQDGDNVVSLLARGGEADLSLVDYIRISYWHSNRADADQLLFTADGQQQVNIGGFSAPSIRVVDVTDPSSAVEVPGTVRAEGGLYAVAIVTPGVGERRLLAFTDRTIARPAWVQANQPSSWHEATNAFDYLLLARREFRDSLRPLVELRERQNYRPAIVDIEDVYDEFSFGEKTPAAMRNFLAGAVSAWQRKPRFAVLVGDATIDPRDYAGFGDFDLVPTKQVPMASVALETASDEWFADFDDDGLPELAVGRLPARSVDQAAAMVSKIVGYETQSAGTWTTDVTLVADENDSATDFEANSRSLASLLPANYRPHEVFRGILGDGTHSELAAQVMAGRLIVNYAGHGSTQIWGRRGDLLSNDEVRNDWNNGPRLPFVIAMNCLNGFFHGIYDEESLAEALLRTPDGGAVAAWASSSLTPPATQLLVNQELFRVVFQSGALTLGEAVARAKQVVSQRDVRRSWIFFGDPAMRLNGVAPNAPAITTTVVVSTLASVSSSAPSNSPDSQGQDSARGALMTDRDFVRLGDYNGDGRDDIFLYATETGHWSIVSSGTQGAANPSGYWPPHLELFAAGLNADRLTDMFLHNAETGEWLAALNTGEGSFRLGPSAWAPRGRARLGDFNGDGRDDVLVADATTGLGVVCLTGGKGSLACRPGEALPAGRLLVADLSGDGLADVFTYDPLNGHWVLGINNGTGGFGYAAGDWSPGWTVQSANLDGDRRQDLWLVDQASGAWVQAMSGRAGTFNYRRGQGPVLSAGHPSTELRMTGVEGPAGGEVHALDVDGDGRDDLLYYNPATGQWVIGLTLASGEVSYTSGIWQAGLTVAWGDMNRDGRADLVLHDPATGRWGSLTSRRPSGTTAQSGTWSLAWSIQGRRP